MVLITLKEALDILKISEATIRRWENEGKTIAHNLIRHKIRFS